MTDPTAWERQRFETMPVGPVGLKLLDDIEKENLVQDQPIKIDGMVYVGNSPTIVLNLDDEEPLIGGYLPSFICIQLIFREQKFIRRSGHYQLSGKLKKFSFAPEKMVHSFDYLGSRVSKGCHSDWFIIIDEFVRVDRRLSPARPAPRVRW